MQQTLYRLLAVILFLTACTARPAPIETKAVSSQPGATASLLPTASPTFFPTETQTASITPLPTISTFTPTFDVRTIVTVTPGPKAECPPIDTAIRPEAYFPQTLDYGSFSSASGKISEFLNRGGSGQLLLERLKRIYPEVEDAGGYGFRDVTGDQVAEFLYIEFYFEGKLLIFSCKDEKFEQVAVLSGDHADHAYSMKIEDLNMDGIPEIILIGAFCGSFCHYSIYLYAWNGHDFTMVAKAHISPMRQLLITDLDGNGTKEILLTGDDPACLSCSNFIPQRQRTITIGWNGRRFVEVSNEFEAPEYRFQAIQDADAMAILGRYEEAAHLYEEAISNEKLAWWSVERWEYLQALHDSWMVGLTLPPEPTEDETEYPRLAAYAYYRIMLLQLAQGQPPEAEATYNTLQQKFGDDPYAQPYVEMATAFWNAYQPTHQMYAGCAAAIQYAAEHPAILIPLGSDYHGWQSHTYVPADVCPFR